MARKIPPRRVPRDRFVQQGGSSGGIFSGASVPGAHTHLEVDITDLDKYSVAAADAAFAPISHTHLEAEITDLGTYLPVSAGAANPVTGAFYLTLGSPSVNWKESDASADNKHWQMIGSVESFKFRTVSDDLGTTAEIMRVERTGTVVDSIALTATSVTAKGNEIITTSGGIFTGNLKISHSAPYLRWDETDAAADEGTWDFKMVGGIFQFRTLNDAESGVAHIMHIHRTGTVVDDVTFYASLEPDTDSAYDLGTSTLFWRTLYADRVVEDLATATKGAATTYTPDARRRIHRIATTGSTVTIANPTNLLLGQTLMIIIKPGATGVTVTWGSQYTINSPTTVVANFHASHPFVFDGTELMQDGAWSSTA